MNRTRKLLTILLVVTAFSFAVGPVLADTIKINPHSSYWGAPVMLQSPATFNAYVSGNSGDGTYDVHAFLVMPHSNFMTLTADVVISWPAGSNAQGSWSAGSVTVTAWNGPVNGGPKLPPAATNGYTVASLKDHLDTDEAIHWAFVPILTGAKLVKDTGIPFTITLSANDPKMGVWLIAKNPGSTDFDNQLPTTEPGFVVPEAAPLLLMGFSFAAMGLFAYRRKIIRR